MPDRQLKAAVGNGGTVRVSQTGQTCASLTIGAGAGESGTVSVTSGELQVVGDLCVGGTSTARGGAGYLVLLGGTTSVGGTLRVWSGGEVDSVSGVLRSSASDADARVAVVNDGLFRVLTGSRSVGAVTGTGTTKLDAGASLGVSMIRQDTISVGAGATLSLQSASCTVSEVRTLGIAGAAGAWKGRVDIGQNCLIIANSSLAAVEDLVRSGMNLSAGYWDGQGIISSAAAGDLAMLTGIGVLDNSAASLTRFGDVGLTGSEIILRYTYLGDADLDGKVDFDRDFILWQTGFLNHLSGWEYGDFNYDGVVDFDNDYILWQRAFLGQSVLPAGVDYVPEPLTLSMIALGVLVLLRRRRTR
jgi:hypothetical protein